MIGIYQVLISEESDVAYATPIFQVVIKNRKIEKKWMYPPMVRRHSRIIASSEVSL